MVLRKVRNIFLHCSDSAFGEVIEIDRWHQQRGWRGIGYHYIILNGRPFRDVNYIKFLDGQVQPGRALNDDPIFSLNEIGAHVAGRNPSSVGICLIGTTSFTDLQLVAARQTSLALVERFGLATEDVLGHYEDPGADKTCPNIPMEHFREYLNNWITISEMQVYIQHHVASLHLA